jgi:DNA-binding XRE family transcriptional regulator
MLYNINMPNIKELREKAFLSVPELSKLSGVTRRVIYDIESSRHKPIRRTIRALAKALGVKPEDITF